MVAPEKSLIILFRIIHSSVLFTDHYFFSTSQCQVVNINDKTQDRLLDDGDKAIFNIRYIDDRCSILPGIQSTLKFTDLESEEKTEITYLKNKNALGIRDGFLS